MSGFIRDSRDFKLFGSQQFLRLLPTQTTVNFIIVIDVICKKYCFQKMLHNQPRYQFYYSCYSSIFLLDNYHVIIGRKYHLKFSLEYFRIQSFFMIPLLTIMRVIINNSSEVFFFGFGLFVQPF